ncbi:MAG: hypothetical protein CR982_05115 [Candidatus Cloacimonadota bacterium]|nr:MAG: hypothetical protein CR982_05115 [Candidatus Cloacimonadota bacterium]PIE78799.1 MAG: hypothetical protein CSA15_06000 [Candidatus Delongbacteria bacterium]
MGKQGVLALILLLTASMTTLFGGDCDQIKKELKALEKTFGEIRKKMGDKGQVDTKEKYNKLKASYNETWKKISAKKVELKKCEQKENQKYKFYLQEAVNLKKSKDYKGAIKKLELSLSEKPDYDKALNLMTEYSAKIKDMKTFNKFIGKVDKKQKSKAYYMLARSYKDSNPKTAIKYYLEAAKYGRQGKSYYWAGVLYYTKLTDYSSAISNFKKSLKYSKSGKTYELLGACYMEAKPTKKMNKKALVAEAIKYLSKGVKLGSKNNQTYHIICARLAQAYNEEGKAKSALNYAIKSLDFSPNKKYGLAHFEKGRALFKMKKYKEAKEAFLVAKDDLILSQNAQYWLKEIEKVK